MTRQSREDKKKEGERRKEEEIREVQVLTNFTPLVGAFLPFSSPFPSPISLPHFPPTRVK